MDLKTPFHIALFLMKLGSHCTFFSGLNSVMPEIRVDLVLAISKTGICLLTSSFLNVLLLWFSAQQVLKKVGYSTFFKLVKISYDSE